jgi:GR25 family glycosyltransferase involved in LPS biosynthesis
MKIYVINLDKRSDRLLFVSKQLSNYTWERFPAVDGYRLNNQILQGMGFYPEQQWIDPLLKRKLTYTEIATSISHYKLWEKCVELDEPIIILEDDGELKQPLDFDEIQTLLASNDIVYLDHREMFPQVAVVEDKFTVPYYPYLATGYAISPATAKKLIHTGFNYNIIPVDEFFPIILGVDYTKHSLGNPNLFLKLQQDYNTQIKAIAYTESVYKQVSRSILGSDIEEQEC